MCRRSVIRLLHLSLMHAVSKLIDLGVLEFAGRDLVIEKQINLAERPTLRLR